MNTTMTQVDCITRCAVNAYAMGHNWEPLYLYSHVIAWQHSMIALKVIFHVVVRGFTFAQYLVHLASYAFVTKIEQFCCIALRFRVTGLYNALHCHRTVRVTLGYTPQVYDPPLNCSVEMIVSPSLAPRGCWVYVNHALTSFFIAGGDFWIA